MDELLLEAKQRYRISEKDPETNPIIEVRNLSVWYDNSLEAVKKLSLPIYPNKITAIIGPNGCGKSTFLRALNRLHMIGNNVRIEGHIFFDGFDINLPEVNEIEVRRKIGLILQRPYPFPHLSIFDNIASGLRFLGMKKKDGIEDIVRDSLEKAAVWNEVKDRLNQKATSLSSGQQQRLCIARALAVKPEVLLLDEPTSALDPNATGRVEDILSELSQTMTLVMVTHSMNQAARLTNNVVFMMNGTIVEWGRTDKIFTSPDHAVTMEYITGQLD